MHEGHSCENQKFLKLINILSLRECFLCPKQCVLKGGISMRGTVVDQETSNSVSNGIIPPEGADPVPYVLTNSARACTNTQLTFVISRQSMCTSH